ncbi:MAG: polyprenyl synthetase family protein [Clostridia bacterium]|nr:polyprenyl synthetase family protein [Clostridia bacterium]
MNFNDKLNGYINRFNTVLSEYLKSIEKDVPKNLFDAIEYSLTPGGKRVRPVLCYAVADALGVELESVDYYSMAVELIHSYSLVHDDLPCMDDDDYRRGKLSTHKQFGEAMGVLAGDGLLNLSFETALKKQTNFSLDISALKVLFDCSGIFGMIKGQVLDLENENNSNATEQLMQDISINKTSKLITAPILISSIMSGSKYYDLFNEYGTLLGLLFQITDDILDVESSFEELGKTPNKDQKTDKSSAVKIYGLEGAKNKATTMYNRCIEILNSIPNTEFLVNFTQKIYKRKS